MAKHNTIGKWGENLAMELLVSKGYAIRETNWRMHCYEIDIVAHHGNRLVFVEVKSRTTNEDDALMAVDRRRMRRMAVAANAYVIANDLPHEVQYDVITIVGNPDSYEIHHIEDAFLAPLKTF